MTDQIAICNMALSSIGTRSTIASMTENSNEAKQCALWYNPLLQMVLRGAHWNFARTQGALPLLADASLGQNVQQPWVYEYAFPPGCVQLRYILPTVQAVPLGQSTPFIAIPDFLGPTVRFVLSSDLDNQGNPINVILTNMPTAIAVWTKLITAEANFDSQFVMALVKTLAAHLCIPLTGDKSLAKLKIEEAQQIVMEARVRNGDEQMTIHDHVPEWMRVRGFQSDWAFPEGGLYFFGPQNLSLIT